MVVVVVGGGGHLEGPQDAALVDATLLGGSKPAEERKHQRWGGGYS